jgi:peptide/nickel transport system substrate-binding protein
MTNRTQFLMAAGAALSLSLAACSSSPSSSTSSSSSPAGAVQQSGNVTIAIDSYPQDINPYSPTIDPQSLEVLDSWFQYLVEPSADGSTLVPTLASSYQISADKKTYTFTLRAGVKFSNGSPMTAADVIYSLQQAFYQKGSQINFLAPKIASITSPDASTVVVKLNSPWPYLLPDLSGFNAPILPSSLVKSEGMTAFLQHQIGTGPFVEGSAVAGSSLTVTRNKYYWQPGLPHASSITFKVIGSDVGRATAVEAGQADVAADPPLNQISTLRSNSSVRVLEFPASQLISIIINTKQAPVNNVKVREAIGTAIDRAAIVQAALFGTGTPATTFIVPPASLTLQDPSITGFGYDPAKAKQLLAGSGLHVPITIQAYFPQGAVQDAISTVMQQNLQAVGINLQIVRSDLVTIKSHLVAGTFQMASSGWDNFIGDPSEQPLFFEDPAYCCHDDFSNYADPAAATLANQAVNATASGTAQSLFQQLQQMEADSAQVIPLYYPHLVFLTSSHVTGFSADPFGTYSYPTIALAS